MRNSTGPVQERWKAAAEAELTSNFVQMSAFHPSTKEELAMHGRPLPMLCVWSQLDDYMKCRACVCGNFAEADPTQQSWTAQAEPSSLLGGLKLGRKRDWTVSKHDVKGAFLNAKMPDCKVVIVSPPELWVRWGLVPEGMLWTLERAVYGLRESPYLWSKERDLQLSSLHWSVKEKHYRLERCSADSQVWMLREDHPDRNTLLGLLIVYVDDFLLQTQLGALRDSFLAALGAVWTLAKEEVLTVDHPITFLGIDIILKPNGDIYLHQQRFVESLLQKYNLTQCKGNTTVQVDKLPETPEPPTPAALKELQGFSGEFNWLATRTRPDMSYYTSLLASACTKFSTWSFELAVKILRFLAGTKGQGILITVDGDLEELLGWTDAGFAGADTKSQNGLVVTWGGTIIVWRSSRQMVSAFSTAEAELNAASLGWQIIEGLRLLIADFGIVLPCVRVLVDNQAAITITKCGANWRTRYFAVRGHRLHEECQVGRADMRHCPTKDMLADALTKLASAPVIHVLHEAMQGRLPPFDISTSPKPGNPADCSGDGPSELVFDVATLPSVASRTVCPVVPSALGGIPASHASSPFARIYACSARVHFASIPCTHYHVQEQELGVRLSSALEVSNMSRLSRSDAVAARDTNAFIAKHVAECKTVRHLPPLPEGKGGTANTESARKAIDEWLIERQLQ
ncbi:MAG: reverse transcriptase domain-containing protein, partial [Candidatus Thermoplasmatota archaeon]|nr:reverse transcriptase domain-containing protein [Candidatus Thermoplasmatota archaeon]